jgi:cell division protease FtsH
MLMGGRVAEFLMLGEISTGSQNDLERAADIARKMVCDYGMSEVIGPIAYEHEDEPVFLGRDITHRRRHSEEFASTIDKEVRDIISNAYQKAEVIVKDNLDKLQRIARALLERETLEGDEVRQLINWDSLIRRKPVNSGK